MMENTLCYSEDIGNGTRMKNFKYFSLEREKSKVAQKKVMNVEEAYSRETEKSNNNLFE